MLTFHVFGAIAQFERALIRERTTAGLVEARRQGRKGGRPSAMRPSDVAARSEEHTSELQSLMRISYAVFCLKKKKYTTDKSITRYRTHENSKLNMVSHNDMTILLVTNIHIEVHHHSNHDT